MKKTNYLKGLGAKLALAVVAFGAAFTYVNYAFVGAFVCRLQRG